MQYGEISIIRNLEEETIFNKITNYFGIEPTFKDTDTIILTLENEPDKYYEIKNEYINKQYTFGPINLDNTLPRYFINNTTNKLAFYIKPHIVNSQPSLDFRQALKNNTKYNETSKSANIFCSSRYNMIYSYSYSSAHSIFSLIKFNNTEEHPRFLVVYDNTYFDTSNLIDVLYCMFRDKFN